MIPSRVDPHRLRLTGAHETAFLVEANGLAVSYENLLVKSPVLLLQALQDLAAQALALVFGQDEEVGVVDDQKSV